jgi:hypothetical protein
MSNFANHYTDNVSSHALIDFANELFMRKVGGKGRETTAVVTKKIPLNEFVSIRQEMLYSEYEGMECYCSFETYCKIRYKWFYK